MFNKRLTILLTRMEKDESADPILEEMNKEEVGEWLTLKGFQDDIVDAFAGIMRLQVLLSLPTDYLLLWISVLREQTNFN